MLKQLRWLIAAALIALAPLVSSAATLLPNGEQQFFDANGAPLAGGFVYFYIPGTSTPKTTWKDPGSTIPNADPVVLDAGGRAVIYGSGSYQQIVEDSLGNLIWNQLTADTSASGASFGGASTGSANSQLVASGSFTASDGQSITFIAGFTNTGATTVTPAGGVPIAVLKDVLSGPTALTGNEIIAGNVVTIVYSQTTGFFHLVTYPFTPGFGAQITVVSAATTNLGPIAGNNIIISGSTTITSFGAGGSLASPLYFVTFSGAPLLTNSASLILPNGANIQASPGDSLLAMHVLSGWQVVSYSLADSINYPVSQLATATSATPAAVGRLGELISSSVTTVSVPNATPTNITSVSLTAGHWNCSGTAGFAHSPVSTYIDWISLSSVTLPTYPNSGGMEQWQTGSGSASATIDSHSIANFRVLIASTTTVYLSGQQTSGGTQNGAGALNCIRTD